MEGDDRRPSIVLNMSSTPLCGDGYCVRLKSHVSQNHHGFKEAAAAGLTTKYGWCCSPPIGIHKMSQENISATASEDSVTFTSSLKVLFVRLVAWFKVNCFFPPSKLTKSN